METTKLTAFKALGNSMVSNDPLHYKDSIHNGSIVLGAQSNVDEISAGAYVITTTSGGVHIKNVEKVDGVLLLHSLNKSFASGVLELNEVTGVYKVVQVQMDRELVN